ncbi:MAG TPA: HNH endonuclease signature motif containing protein, partial [Candidatus Dojkabacteria bacterium]|nr:HNH endonuclease signature motif containing protein [Candidatus Dojkabacteria bacterium]
FDSGLVVDHIDGNKHNNSISNLRIVTHKENARNKLLNIPDSGYRQIRKTQDGKCYGVRWTEDSGRKYKQFRIKDYETENDCLNESYVFRDSLIKCGKLSPRIKEGEAEIGR